MHVGLNGQPKCHSDSWSAPPSSYVSQHLVKCQGPYHWRKHAPGCVVEWWVSSALLLLFVPPCSCL